MRKAGRRLAAMMLAGIMMAAIGGCSGKQNAPLPEIKIGVNMELSGKYGKNGEMAVKGMQLAVQEINERGGMNGRKVRLLVGDNKSDAATALAVFEQQVKSEHVVAVLGPKNSDTAISLGALAAELKTPFIATSATHPRVTVDDTGRVKPYAFRACFTDPFQGTAMAAFSLERLNSRRAALLIDATSEYSRGLAAFFEQEFSKRGGTVVKKWEYHSGETDFTRMVSELQAAEADLLFVPGFPVDVSRIVVQSRNRGFEGPIVGSDSWDMEVTRAAIGKEYMKKMFYCDIFSVDDNDIKVAEFTRKFAKISDGRLPNAAAVFGYDAALLLLDALKRAPQLEGEPLRAALEQTQAVE